jgi:anti-anti-sigma regulatory factor
MGDGSQFHVGLLSPSSGVAVVLVEGLRRVKPCGGALDVVCDRPNVVRTFRVTGLLGIFGLFEDREEAVAAAGTPA